MELALTVVNLNNFTKEVPRFRQIESTRNKIRIGVPQIRTGVPQTGRSNLSHPTIYSFRRGDELGDLFSLI